MNGCRAESFCTPIKSAIYDKYIVIIPIAGRIATMDRYAPTVPDITKVGDN